jgi:hypothetical protein
MKDPNAPDRPATQEGAIKAIDDKIFIDQNTHLKTYQAFDHDKDGYVSANDIRNTLITKNWMEAPEREQFVSYVDPENKGTVDFRQFSSKVRRNMTNWDEKGGHKERNIMQPAKEHVEKRKNEADYMSKTFTNLRRTYLPDTSGSSISPYKEMEGKTRYGMTPVSKNTFTNFQVPEYSSPM